MSNFYNTSSPTPTTLNTINSVSPSVRDFLLNKNISSTYPSISTAINGSPHVGDPVLDTETNFLNTYPHQQLDLNTQNIDLLGSVLNGQGIGIGNGGSLVPNFDVRSSLLGRVLGATGNLNDTKIGTIGAQQLALALANNAAFNVEQKILGSLNLQDNILALAKGDDLPGFRPNYKITVPNTALGTVFNFATSVLGFTVPRSYLDDKGSIFQDESGPDTENIARANAMLMNTGKGQQKSLIKNMVANISVNTGDAKFNFFRSGYSPAYARANSDTENPKPMISSNLYAYDNGQGHFVHLLDFSEGGVIPTLSISRALKTENSGFIEMPSTAWGEFTKPFPTTETWITNETDAVNNEYTEGTPIDVNDSFTKKSLLVKTQRLFNNKGFKTLVSSQGDLTDGLPTQLQTAVVGGGISKGNAVLRGDRFNFDSVYKGNADTAKNTYCRSYTSHDRYDKVLNLVRDRELYTSEGKNPSDPMVPFRLHNTSNSVLEDNGMPKIAPYKDDKFNKADTKKYMFSIENLAWADNVGNLPIQEQGPGDLISGKKGRIMWFPPYDINFSEQNNVSWESTNFIGRGEPVYTYNNTERTGNLSFKVIVDHPSYVNAFAGHHGPDDHYINSFWAGCVEPNKYFSDKLTAVEYGELISIMPKPQVVTPTPETPPPSMFIYWANDNSGFDSNFYRYENGKCDTTNINYDLIVDGYGCGINEGYKGNYTPGLHKQGTPNSKISESDKTASGSVLPYQDKTNYGLNYNGKIGLNPEIDLGDGKKFRGWFDRPDEYKTAIIDYLKNKCPHCKVEVYGYASPHGTKEYNQLLANDRRDFIYEKITQEWGVEGLKLTDSDIKKRFVKKDATPLVFGKNSDCNPEFRIDNPFCKVDRRTEIRFVYDKQWAAADIPKPVVNPADVKTINKKIASRYYNESNYFEKLKKEDYFVFDKFREKIRYFHPAFHSTTPEGLNSRLTFLLQCTRQGATLESQDANNLAFGRPPVCILRIGDFYNTKIVMDNVSIDYDPLVWDLNPEGIGVQPMIANVTISFKFLGGSSLDGPLNKLQNALSFNYFANTQVYDPRADYIDVTKNTLTNGLKSIKESDKPIIDDNYQLADKINQPASSEAANN